jgi:hypothetical protein
MATARSGGVCRRSIASVSAVLVAGSRRRLRRRRARVVVLAMSGDVLVARACSTASQGGQGVLVVVARHVASVCPRRAHARRERRPGRVWARVVRPMSSSSATMAVLGRRRRGGGMLWRRGQGWGSKGERGRWSARRHGRHGHVLASLLLSLAQLCGLDGLRGPGNNVV